MIVPAIDAPRTLPRCLAAIAAAEAPPDEVIVVDRPAGTGPAQARNTGVKRARGALLAFVDSDVEVHKDAFVRIRSRFAEDPHLTAISGSYDDDPAAGRTVSDFRNLLHHHVHHSSAGTASSFWAGLGAIRSDAFHALGGFDAARYPAASIEDIDLGMRLAAAGGLCRIDPAIQGKHLKRWTLRSMVQTDFRLRGVPWVMLMLRNRRTSDRRALNLGWRHRLSALAALSAVLGAASLRPRCAMAAVASLVPLNRKFYALLLRRRGARFALTGIGLHGVHHLVAVTAVPAGIALHLRGNREPWSGQAPDYPEPPPAASNAGTQRRSRPGCSEDSAVPCYPETALIEQRS